jgi:hypothetical protein
MIPAVEHLMKRRHHTRRRLRFISLVLTVVGSMPITYLIVQSSFHGSWWSNLLYSGYAAIASMFVMPALVLWVFDGPLSRALVPFPRAVCPKCGYSLVRLTRPLCPECGLRLPEACVQREREDTN